MDQLQGRGEFLLSFTDNSEDGGKLVTRDAIYLDGTLLTVSGSFLAEWTGTGTIAGILLGPERSANGNRICAYIAREAVVEVTRIRIPVGFEQLVVNGFNALDIVARGIVVPEDEDAIHGILGAVIGAANVKNKDGVAVHGILGSVIGAAAVTLVTGDHMTAGSTSGALGYSTVVPMGSISGGQPVGGKTLMELSQFDAGGGIVGLRVAFIGDQHLLTLGVVFDGVTYTEADPIFVAKSDGTGGFTTWTWGPLPTPPIMVDGVTYPYSMTLT